MPAYHNICSKLDRALVAYLLSLNLGTPDDILPAKRAATRSLPLTVCFTERADPIPNTGSYTCRATILLKSHAADTSPAASDARTAATFDAFHTILDHSHWDSKKIAAQITAAARAASATPGAEDLADLTLLDVRLGAQEAAYDHDGDVFVESLQLEIDAAPSNVS
ncbi:MAG TPA: hypothetical protein P5169_01945 [Kiritimatiellia bacterium]|jgi:hypothetical protein|nr:hypothetical protein [Kiritimatiellia bacterium]